MVSNNGRAAISRGGTLFPFYESPRVDTELGHERPKGIFPLPVAVLEGGESSIPDPLSAMFFFVPLFFLGCPAAYGVPGPGIRFRLPL